MFHRIEQMLEETCPRHSRKALISLSFLMGLVVGTALLNVVQVETGAQRDAAVELAAQPRAMQPARLQQLTQPPKARQFLQPLAASRSEPEIDIVVGRREAAAAFAAVLSAAFAPQSANAAAFVDKRNKWGTAASSNGRRDIYAVEAPKVGTRPTEEADTSKIPSPKEASKYTPPKEAADTSYELLKNNLKSQITEMTANKKSGVRS